MPRTTEATRLAIPVQNPHEIPEEKNPVFAEYETPLLLAGSAHI
jgi:hypothetical protein